MIDGVKIDVPNLSGYEWLSNDLLDFYTYTNTKTGELKDGTQVAKYKGLTFIITSSIKHKGVKYCSVRGSLHKYYNNGETNANDFTIHHLQDVINELFKQFSINPETAILRNVEFGVNIYVAITSKALIDNLVALYSDPFTDFKIDGFKIGKGIGKQRYTIKLYDKGKQENLPVKNLLRIEVAVKKMQYLQRFNIETLSDLLKPQIKPLGGLLVEYWVNAIYYDKQVSWKQLTDFDRKKLLYYATPRNWAEFTRKQRLRARAHFQKILTQYGTTSTHAETAILISEKWNDLTALKCPRLNHDSKENKAHDLSTFDPLECKVKMYPSQRVERKQKNTLKMSRENKPEKSNYCRTCAKDISNKKSNSFYCSKRCNNSYHAKQRKKKRHSLKKAETTLLNTFIKHLATTQLHLLIVYVDNGIYEAVNLYQNEINAPFNWVRKVVKVTIHPTGKILTSYRAKRLVNSISKLNQRNNE